MNQASAGERLNRHLARRGVASRRGADGLIAAGRVAVNGRRAALGASVSPKDRVTVDGRPVAAMPRSTTLMLNKPAGVVTTRRDPQRRPTVMQAAPAVPGLVPVGRLDADSRGLLLLTNDGELAHRVTHPRFGLRRLYRVTVSPPPSPRQVRSLLDGVMLEDGPARALAARRLGDRSMLEITMGEGRRREVRRLCAAAGLEVLDLQRTGYGPLRLGGLGEGEARELRDDELELLRASVGLGAAAGR